VLLPLLPEATHPAIHRLAEFVRRKDGAAKCGALAPRVRSDSRSESATIGVFRLLEMERGVADEVLDGIWIAGQKPSFAGWDILRSVGGEIQEVSAFAESEELLENEPVLVAGRFEESGLFHVTLLPREKQPSWRLTVIGSAGRVELLFPLGWKGPAYLDWRDANGEPHEEYWQHWDPWPALIETFEHCVERLPRVGGETPALRRGGVAPADASRPRLSWQDTLRALELDDAARRSVERRRSSLLEYPEATEEVGFKGTMTLVGCSLVWGTLLLLILSVWWPKLGWLIVPLIVVFLSLQLLRYFIPRSRENESPK